MGIVFSRLKNQPAKIAPVARVVLTVAETSIDIEPAEQASTSTAATVREKVDAKSNEDKKQKEETKILVNEAEPKIAVTENEKSSGKLSQPKIEIPSSPPPQQSPETVDVSAQHDEKLTVTEIEHIDSSEHLTNPTPKADETILPVLRLTPNTASTIPKTLSYRYGAVWQWNTDTEEIRWDIRFEKMGEVNLSIDIHDIQCTGPFTFLITICETELKYTYDPNYNYPTFPLDSCHEEFITRIPVGILNIRDNGLATLTIRVTEMTGEYVGNLRLIDLTGIAAESAVILSQVAHSVSTLWELKECRKFYSAVEVSESCPGTFFGLYSFNLIQCGLYDCQGHRSVWFRVNQERNSNRDLEIVEIGEDVKLTDKKNEDSVTYEGVFHYAWNFDTQYHFIVKQQEVDDVIQCFVYFYKEEEEMWKRVVVFEVAVTLEPTVGCMIEDRRLGREKVMRRAKFGPGWFWNGKEWKEPKSVLPDLVGHVLNADFKVEDDKVCLFLVPDNLKLDDIYSPRELLLFNVVPSVLNSFSE